MHIEHSDLPLHVKQVKLIKWYETGPSSMTKSRPFMDAQNDNWEHESYNRLALDIEGMARHSTGITPSDHSAS